MDPNACLDLILTALANKEFESADIFASDIIHWLSCGGFAPRRSAEIELNRAMTDGMEPENVPRCDELSRMLKGDE